MTIEFPRSSEIPKKVAPILFSNSQQVVVEWCSPKSARLESGLAWLTEQAILTEAKDAHFWHVSPDFSSVSISMTTLKSALTPGSFNSAVRSSAFTLINGSTIWFRSAESLSSLYSDSVYALVIDDAIHMSEKVWDTLSRTIANTRAPTRILSTVAGRKNWFYDLARRAEENQESLSNLFAYLRFTAIDALEENYLTQSDIDYARNTLPDHIFKALYLAQPYDDRVETAYRASDPRLMTDTELAIVANLDPTELSLIPDETLVQLSQVN